MKTAIALLSLLASGCSSAPTATTTDFVPHVVRCPVKNERNIDAIFGQTKLDIWSHETAPGGTIDVYVQRPAELAIVEETLELKRTDCETLINDVPELIKSQTTAEMGRNGGRKIIWNSEMEVNDFFNDYQVNKRFPQQLLPLQLGPPPERVPKRSKHRTRSYSVTHHIQLLAFRFHG